MIRKDNLESMIQAIGYQKSEKANIYEKKYIQYDCTIIVDFNGSGSIIYPEEKGMRITRKTTCNFSEPENFVVLECITRLMDKGYRPEHIELEKEWPLGHKKKSGFADILVKDEEGKTLFIVECKTSGNEYKKEYNSTLNDGGQLFSYWRQEGNCKWLSLYASDFDGTKVFYTTETIDCSDDANILVSAKKDSTIQLYKNAHTAEELYAVWNETYDKRLCGDVIFREDSQAYQIGVKPLRKADLKDFSENDKVVNKFEEILRHNNVSDKENAFNRLIALFICKLVDEMQKGEHDIVDFQYKVGTDTYETLQDRLQRLHKEGIEKFIREEIFYVPDDYAEHLVQQYTGQKRQKMIADLRRTLHILKFYTNNDFAFKDVHNEELFYQNGKILVEVVQLFEKYRIIGSNDIQMLGDLFEQLLNKGFKQNEGQFFTPIPITRFIWDSLPVTRIIKKADGIEFPKIIDYACGAGHFLTQGFEAVNAAILSLDPSYPIDYSWTEHNIFGVEKDYRLARVSKISLFMHGAGDGNIVFGDGLENYPDKDILPESFDILVANPPYSVKAFKPHLKLKNNNLKILDKISNDGSEIETLFVERISQLVKPEGVAAVVLPTSILNKENESFIAAREAILKNFMIRAIALFGNKTFGATGTNTAILFLEKLKEPPKRIDLVSDSVTSIFEANELTDWEDNDIFHGYLNKIHVGASTYNNFVKHEKNYYEWQEDEYFKMYYDAFVSSAEYGNKSKQKNFRKLSKTEQLAWYNEHFYNYAHTIEKEKLTYFALIYQQTTLIITAPDDNKAQEKFLGYKWSNRKGQEGIQIITPGGMLYSEDDRNTDQKVCGLIRSSFSDKKHLPPELDAYAYYLNLKDMIDFSSLSFGKTIKTTKTRILKSTPGFTRYKLSNTQFFDVSIGNRVLSEEVEEHGSIPIYSANVFEEFGRTNKQLITDFSMPSILWGIDGDWMVNLLPSGMPFYPTDHCGILRIKINDIVPEYLALALEHEGKLEKFSRSNRASTQRIKNLTLQIPTDKKIQQDFVDKVTILRQRIQNEEKRIAENDLLIKEKYKELFANRSFSPVPLSSISTYFIGLTYQPKDVSNDGTIVLRSGNIQNQKLDFNDIVRVSCKVKDRLYVSEDDILMCSRNGSPKLVGKVAIIKNLPEKMTFGTFMTIIRSKYHRYLWAYLQSDDFRNQITNGKTMSINQITTKMLDKIIVPLPDKVTIDTFTKFVMDIEKKIDSSQTIIASLKEQQQVVMNKHFS